MPGIWHATQSWLGFHALRPPVPAFRRRDRAPQLLVSALASARGRATMSGAQAYSAGIVRRTSKPRSRRAELTATASVLAR